MKIAAAVLMFAGVFAFAGAGSVFADGGKVRGEIADGPALQLGETPFGDGLYEE